MLPEVSPVRQQLPPGPSAPSAWQTIGFWTRPTAFLERCRQRYGTPFTLRLLGSPPFVMIADPDDIKQVFTAPTEVLHPGEGARILEPIVGRNSVILLDEQPHLEQRKLLLPAFHGESMQRLAGVMAAITEAEVASWPRDTPVALHTRLQRLTLEIILQTVFGLRDGARLDRLRTLTAQLLSFGESPLSLIPDSRRFMGGRGVWARLERDSAEADELIYGVIRERRASGERHDDVLDLLLGARHGDGSEMSDVEIRDELMTALVAGHETTASQLTFAFERLAREPAVLARLVDEVDAGEDDAYLTATIHEIMRAKPVLPNAEPRLVKEPYEVGGFTYPVGVVLMANAFLVHHDPAIYPEPYAFRPERFLDQTPGTYTWIPFGGGRRRCLGASFSMQEMKLVLREVLGRCELAPASPVAEATRRRAITISPARGGTVVLHDRTPRTTPGRERVPETALSAAA
jgi:cytochrome P450